MASNSKRKRSNIPESREATSTPPKRRKKTADRRSSKGKPADFLQSSQESEPFYEAKAILKEEGNKYLIDWADHPTTGETYAPTWEPKKNANKLLVEDWRRRQREEKNPKQSGQASVSPPAPAPSPTTAAASPTESSLAPAPQPKTTPKRKSSIPKHRRLIQSSSPDPHSAPNQLSVDSSLSNDDSRIVPETELRDSKLRAEPVVHITHPTGYNPSEYEHISASQVLSSPQQSRPAVESSQESAISQQSPEGHTIPAERLLQQPRFGSGVVIPDSQNLPGDSSYVPSTQTRSGAESQPAQSQSQSRSQSQPLGSADASAPQDSSASTSAQFTNPQEDDSSGPVLETDPIEDEPSSPATHSHHEERHPPPRESPWHTASSASSPPPIDSPVKSTQSESRVGNTEVFVEVQSGTPVPAENEHAQDSEAEVFSRSLSPKSRPEEQYRLSPKVQEPQQPTVWVEREEEVDRDLRGFEEQEGLQDSQVLVPQSYPTEEQQYEQPVPEVEREGSEKDQHEPDQEESVVTEAAPAVARSSPDSGQGAVREDLFAGQRALEAEGGAIAGAVSVDQTAPEIEGFTAEVVPTVVGSAQDIGQDQTEHQHEPTSSAAQSTDSDEAHHFVTCPERTTEGAAEVPVEFAKGAEFSLQDQAEISTQDVTDPPENTPDLQFAQRDFAPNHNFDSATSRELEERSSEHHGESLQPAQYVSELDLDGPQSSHRTQISEGVDPAISSDLKHTQSPRRKDSSQDDNLELSVLGQADPNVIRRPYEPADSDVLTQKDIVASVETREELPRRGYFRKLSRGMPRTSQAPDSSVGGIEPATPTGSLTERLREVHSRSRAERERRKAKIYAQVDESVPKSPSAETSTRSPSTIPPNVTQTNMEPQYTLIPSNLSAEARPNESHLPTAQNDHDMPDIHHLDDDTDMHDGSTPSILLDDPILGDAEYLVGLSMEGLQGDQYRREITFKESSITHFLEDDPVCETHAYEVRGLLNRLSNTITHMDLGFGNADALTQYEGGPENGMVAWTNNSSTKFRFLGGILEDLRGTKFHFVVLGCQGALMDILEKFVDGLRIPYSRGGYIDREAFEARESLFVTILATDFDNVDTSIPKAHLIFAMDSTVQCHDPKIKALRNHLSRDIHDSIPVITPIVTNSIEHVERCISPSVQGFIRERLVVRFMTELRQLAGRVDVSTKADQAVRLLVPSIASDLDHHEAWPLLRVSSIKNDVHFEDSMISTLSVPSWVPVGTLSPSAAGQKRHLDVGEEESAKRTRITPQPETGTINPNEITHVSDSAPVPSSSTVDKELRRELELEQIKTRAKDYEDALTECQREKEEQRDIILQLKRENEALKLNQVNVSARIRTQNETIDGLRDERNTLHEQLEEARKQLASSTVPEVAEREQLRRERDEALAKLKRVQKMREAQGNESDFFREQFQEASRQATLLQEGMQTLTQQVRELEKLKTGERDKARQLSLTSAEEAYKDEMERLQIQLNERNTLLQQKNDELKAIRGRQGVGTRAGSVPRSPRISGPGSRGGSPAPSGLGGHGRLGALRNINA